MPCKAPRTQAFYKANGKTYFAHEYCPVIVFTCTVLMAVFNRATAFNFFVEIARRA
jgi:hypothetical protein